MPLALRLTPPYSVAREHAAYAVEQVILRHRELGFGLLCLVFLAILDRRDRGAEDQVLDLHLALGLLVAALDHGARRAALIGIFHLRAEFAGAEIKLGANTGAAQRRDHFLVVR